MSSKHFQHLSPDHLNNLAKEYKGFWKRLKEPGFLIQVKVLFHITVFYQNSLYRINQKTLLHSLRFFPFISNERMIFHGQC